AITTTGSGSRRALGTGRPSTSRASVDAVCPALPCPRCLVSGGTVALSAYGSSIPASEQFEGRGIFEAIVAAHPRQQFPGAPFADLAVDVLACRANHVAELRLGDLLPNQNSPLRQRLAEGMGKSKERLRQSYAQRHVVEAVRLVAGPQARRHDPQ